MSYIDAIDHRIIGLATLLLTFTTIAVSAQAEQPELDCDGTGPGFTKEVLTRHTSHGSGLAGTSCDLEQCPSGRRYSAGSCRSVGTFTGVVAIPEGFESIQSDFFKSMLETCATLEMRDKPDPSFQWWLDAYQEFHKSEKVDGHAEYKWEIPLRFHEGPPEYPEHHSIHVTGEIATSFQEPSDWCGYPGETDIDADLGIWLNYFGLAHRRHDQPAEFQVLSTADTDKLLGTRHGVVLQREDRYAWIFVSDLLWGGPSKLRFQSILDAGFIDEEWIWIAQSDPLFRRNSSIWIVHLKTGRTTRLPLNTLEWSAGDRDSSDEDPISLPNPPAKIELQWSDDTLHIAIEDEEGTIRKTHILAEELRS